MFYQNEGYNHKLILNNYCGFRNRPIWGEVQHSFWFRFPITQYKNDKFFPKIYTWNVFLRNKSSIAIGDPWNYLTGIDEHKEKEIQSKLRIENKFMLLVPKQTDFWESEEFEFRRIKSLIRTTERTFPNISIVLILHLRTEKRKFIEELKKLIQSKNHCLIQRNSLKPEETLYLNQFIYRNNSGLITNYFGSHNLRASLQKKEVFFIDLIQNTQATKGEIYDLYKEYLSSQNSQLHISKLLLGVEERKSPDELSELLGFTKLKGISGRWVKKIHNHFIY